jgi:Uma2 family endonuclease
MGHAQTVVRLDPAAYLEWEARQPARSEYLRGEALAMVGARRRHVLVAMNLGFALRQHLRAAAWQVFIADMKLRVEAVDAFFYPDVVVTCDPRDAGDEDRFVAHPKLVIEVLSESTAAFDLGVKLDAYRLLDTLVEYAVVDPDRFIGHVYRRGAEGRWSLHDAAAGEPLRLESVGIDLPHAEVFAGVDRR